MVAAGKYQAYGNDFLIVEGEQLPEKRYPDFSRQICRPHFGLGSDGCVFLESSTSGPFRIRFFNLDGSEAEMSGNGARCAAAFIHHRRLTECSEIRFLTSSGEKVYSLIETGPPVWKYTSAMGLPEFSSREIPFLSSETREKLEDYKLSVGDYDLRITALSVGNPQCVVFSEELPKSPDFERISAALETHPLFPERTNISFVQVLNPHQIRIKIWERGVGATYSSGTGSSGAAVAAISTARVLSPVEVQTETGTQLVQWSSAQEILLTGEARFVADIDYHWQD